MANIQLEHAARPITSLSLPQVLSQTDLMGESSLLRHFLRVALHSAGYKSTADVLQVSESDLVAELSIGLSLAKDILRQCRDSPGPSEPTRARPDSATAPLAFSQPHAVYAATAADLLSDAYLPHFSTLSHSIDSLIAKLESTQNGGAQTPPNGAGKGKGRDAGAITPGMVLEISGPPGIGKTSVALGIVLSSRMGLRGGRRLSERSVADSGEALIIDTEGAMTPDRIRAAAISQTRATPMTARSIVTGIHLVRIATQVQMIAFINSLDWWLQDHPKVNIVVIDTLSFHFRQPYLDMGARRRVMDTVKQQIAKATTVHRCAVINLNQLATKLFTSENKQGNFDNGDKAVLMPQLGDLWTTAKTIRLALFRGPPGDDLRYAHASTSSDGNAGEKWACFDIDSEGIPCDIAGAGDLSS